MHEMKRAWDFLVVEPLTSIYYCFFLPEKFNAEKERRGFFNFKHGHIIPTLQLLISTFLFSYLFALLIHIISAFLSHSPWLTFQFFIVVAAGSFVGILAGLAFGMIGPSREMILLAIIGGVTADIPFGLAIGLTAFTLSDFTPLIILVLEGFILGWILSKDFTKGLRVAVAVVIFIIAAKVIVLLPLKLTATTDVGRIMTEDIIAGIIVGFVLDIWTGVGLAIMLFTARLLTGGDLIIGLYSLVSFLIGYFIGFSRILSYLLYSRPRSRKISHASKRDPENIFTYLDQSPLYHDERLALPLPGLAEMLSLAGKQDKERTREIIDFIVLQRPAQREAAWAAAREIAIADLKACTTIEAIANVSDQLTIIEFVDPSWIPDLQDFDDVSKDARYFQDMAQNKKAKEIALDNMEVRLQKLTHVGGFRERDLVPIAEQWLKLVKDEKQELKAEPPDEGYIDIPYITGAVLPTGSSLYVGRRDLLKKLGEILNSWRLAETTRRAYNRSPILLTGERRMGKTSTLHQLAHDSGGYVPVIVTLSPSAVSSSVAFLYTLAEGIYDALRQRAWNIEKITYKDLAREVRGGERSLYALFNRWLNTIEQELKQQKRLLLLMIDEYELLAEIGEVETTDQTAEEQSKLKKEEFFVRWLQDIIQNHSTIMLLFSGLYSVTEFNEFWKDFSRIKLEQMKVSFLQPEEARRLILRPTENFRGEEIFSEDVVSEIIEQTACHPFFVQAVCEELLRLLNREKRKSAKLADIDSAISAVQRSWSAFLDYLWKRSDENQQKCLHTLIRLQRADRPTIEKDQEMSPSAVEDALRRLNERDLIFVEDGIHYRIAVPLFAETIQRRIASSAS